jgi:DNA-binding SARP family transcriptional activator
MTDQIARPPLVVRLLGRFDADFGPGHAEAVHSRKSTDLLSYLFLFHQRPHHREVLASTIWPDSETEQSKKYLRQSLWRLRSSGALDLEPAFLHIDPEWVHVDPGNLWIDVAELEKAYERTRSTPGEQLSAEDARQLKAAVSLYRGDLLEGCYLDWCVYERERVRALYLSLMERLLGYCEAHFEYDEGLAYGEILLRHDHAHERAHLRLMRLRYLAGDRTGALRQFEQCRQALRTELQVEPGDRIRKFYDRIRADGSAFTDPRHEAGTTSFAVGLPTVEDATDDVPELLQGALRTLGETARLIEAGLQHLRGARASD